MPELTPRCAAITAVAAYVPERVLSNADLARTLDTSDEWIVTRTGIRERRIGKPGETTSTMGAEAVRRLDGVLSGKLRVQMRVRRIPRPRKSPDSRSESGLDEEFGTAYRIPGEMSHVSQPRTPSASKRRMRRMRQGR
jgi:hypothetical protein